MTGAMRRWLTGVAGGVALAVTAGLTTAATAAQADDHTATQAVLDQYVSVAGPGAAVYAGDATGSWTLSSGTATTGANRPITAGDHFRIGSQTKTFTSVVVLQLVDEGLVELDAPIERYLPGVVTGNYDGNVITVRQLLQHTSGLVRDIRDARANPDGTYSLAELVASAMDEPPQSAPGAAVNYSNVAYLVLGMLVERLTGEDVGTAITKRIIEPLGLADTTFPVGGDRALAAPYLLGYLGGRIPPFYFWYEATTGTELTLYSSAGAMQSTLADLAVFYRGIGDLLSPAALAEMHRTVPAGAGGEGLGVDEMPLSCGGVAWAKNGALPNGHTSFTAVTDDGRFASMVTNTFATTTDALTKSVAVLDSALCA
jgi:D-alanyl-D-alanine carboxypeptidase